MTSDPFVTVAIWAGVVAVAMTLLLAVLITGMRLRLARETAHWLRFVERWRPVLMQATLDDAVATAPPPLVEADRERFLRLWMYVHESVRGDGHLRLAVLARHLGIDATVRAQLLRGARTARLQAVLAAGLLRDAQAWDRLAVLAADRDPLLSVSAARALVRIDPQRAVPLLMPAVTGRPDWDPALAVGVVAEARTAWEAALVQALPAVRPDRLPRALRLAASLRLALPASVLAPWLLPSQPADLLQAALPLAGQPEALVAVRRLLAHPEPGVRVEALRCMAVLAGPGDLFLLKQALADPAWPVRLAAARALADLPFLSPQALGELVPAPSTGAQALRHVMAERGHA